MRSAGPVLIAGLLALLCAAPSHASTAGSANGLLTVSAAPGEANEIDITYVPTVAGFQVEDVFNPLAASVGCAPMRGTAICPALGVARIVVDAGDGSDTVDLLIEASPVPVPATVRGGKGNDFLFGSTGADAIVGGGGNDSVVGRGGNDELKGGKGVDVLSGGAGIDRLFAADGRHDQLLNCGPGSNSRERARVDRSDPRPKSC